MIKYASADYELHSSVFREEHILVRRRDAHIARLDKEAFDMLLISPTYFNSIAATYKFIDPIYEK